MTTHHSLGSNNLKIVVSRNNQKKYQIEGVYLRDEAIIIGWEAIVALSVIVDEFGHRKLPKEEIFNISNIEEIQFRHIEKSKQHYLKMTVDQEDIFILTYEAKLMSALLNRVIARCDVLDRSDNWVIQTVLEVQHES